MDNTQSLGTAKLDIVVDLSQLDAAIEQGKRGVTGLSQAAQDTYNQMNAAQKRQIDSLVRQADQIGKTRAEQILYNAAARGVPTQVLDELKNKIAGSVDATKAAKQGMDQLAASTKGVGTAAKGIEQVGMSARATAAAMRQVPAQVTDIVTGLASGQRPFTVLLQQGGQLKDVFGGVVPAAKALGSTVLGMISPFTLAAGAAVALFAAYEAGAAESDKFNAALVRTNSYAGYTAAGLSDLAKSVADTSKTTKGNAADVISQVVASGQFAGNAIGAVATAAIDMQKDTGQAIDATISQFKALAEDPVKASRTLNSEYHYLTAAVYEQIAALAEQGNKTGAAQVASEAFANAIANKTPEIQKNLGYVERSWEAIKSAIKGAADAAIDFGRADTNGTQISTLEKSIAAIQDRANGPAGLNDRGQKLLDTYKAELVVLKEQQAQQQAIARGRSAVQQGQERDIEQRATRTSYLQARKGTSLQSSIDDENKEFAKATAGLAETSKEYEDVLTAHNARVAQIQKQFKGSTKAYTDDEATKLLQQYRDGDAALQAQLNSQQKIGTWQQKLVEFEQQIADLKEKRILTADQKSLLANQDALRTQLQKNAADEKSLQLKQDGLKLAAFQQSLDAKAAQDAQQYGDQEAAFGLGTKEQQQLRARTSIYRDYQRDLDQVTRDHVTDKTDQGVFDSETAALSRNLEERLGLQQTYFDDIDKLQGDWQLGIEHSYADYIDASTNAYQQAGEAFNSITSGMENAFASFITTGKIDFKSFVTSILADLARISAKKLVGGILESIVGSLAGGGAYTDAGGTIGGAALGGASSGGGSLEGFLAGGRAGGGPTDPNSLYRVNEEGPELYTVDGKTYLMSGGAGGYVTPLKQGASAASAATTTPKITVHNHGTPQDYEVGGITRDEVVLIARNQVYQEGPRMVSGELSSANSRSSRALQKGYKVERNR